MSTPRGYPTQQKDDRVPSEFVTVEPIRVNQHGLSVLAHQFVEQIVSDAVEAGSTTFVINATAHSAIKGDIIFFTSGAFVDQGFKVLSVTVNTITLAETLSAAPGTGDTFLVYRHRFPVVDATGKIETTTSVSGIASAFDRETGSGPVLTNVLEDTVTPANNLGLPVRLISPTGLNVVVADRVGVQTRHDGAGVSSMRIGDGTTLVGVTTAGELVVSLDYSTVDFFDTPLLDASSSNIPGSAGSPLAVVASLAARVRKIQVFDTTGEFFGIYTGPAASEVLVAVVGPGSNESIEVDIAAATRISLRSLTASAITVGEVSMNFVG